MSLVSLHLVSHTNRVQEFKNAARALNLDLKLIANPGCGLDISPSVAFPQSRILYIDPDKEAHQVRVNAGYESYEEKAEYFTPPEPLDLLILINQGCSPKCLLPSLKLGAHVFCNDYHGAATYLWKDPGYELRGVATGSKYITEALHLYFEPVDSDASWKSAQKGFSCLSYRHAADMIRQAVEVTGEILPEYLRLMEEAKADSSDNSGMYTLKIGYHTLVFTPLPNKQGSCDDLYIFQKM
jgi:hypothetical protein